MAMRRKRRMTSRSKWREGHWTGDVFGFPCTVAGECEQLLGGAPFNWPPAADPCATQVFYPLLNFTDIGGGTGVIPTLDKQERATYKFTDLYFDVIPNPEWVMDAQQLGITGGILEFPWRAAVFKADDDEVQFASIDSLFNEEWLTMEHLMWYQSGYVRLLGGATVMDRAQRVQTRIRRPVRITTGQGVYLFWEMGCVTFEGQQYQGYTDALNGFGEGPIGVIGCHRTFFLQG